MKGAIKFTLFREKATLKKDNEKKDPKRNDRPKEKILSDKTIETVADLNSRFSRARYMDRDAE